MSDSELSVVQQSDTNRGDSNSEELNAEQRIDGVSTPFEINGLFE